MAAPRLADPLARPSPAEAAPLAQDASGLLAGASDWDEVGRDHGKATAPTVTYGKIHLRVPTLDCMELTLLSEVSTCEFGTGSSTILPSRLTTIQGQTHLIVPLRFHPNLRPRGEAAPGLCHQSHQPSYD